MENGPFIVDLPIKIVIFHSYDSLPELFSEHSGSNTHVGPMLADWKVETPVVSLDTRSTSIHHFPLHLSTREAT